MTSRLDFEFANNVRAGASEYRPGLAWLHLALVSALVVSAIGWASMAVVDEVTTGVGRVIPSRQLQVVQTLEGGIVREIHVREGDRVDADQILMRIDDTTFASRLGEMTTRRTQLVAEIARLEAEAEGLDSPLFDTASAAAELSIATELQTFRARRAKLESETAVLRQQLVQRAQELAELEARRSKLDASLALLSRELALNREMSKRGAVPELEVLRLERQLADLKGDRDINGASIPRAQAAIQEAQDRLTNARTAFEAQARERLATARGELAIIEESIKGARDRVRRTALASPVAGVVNKLSVTTIGAVLQPGQVLAEIVPVDETLLIETQIRPQDVAFIGQGQPASVKLSAYDYLVYGALDGRVERIGADTISDPKGETYYRVIVRTDRNHLGADDRKLPIIPGMIARVDIQTGEKTVLDYLLKPLLRARNEALRER